MSGHGRFWSPEEYDGEAQKLYEKGDYDAALSLLREGLAVWPDAAELLVSLGYTQLAREEFAWARRAFGQALEIEEDHEDALIGLGEVLLKLGERARGLRCFDRVLELGFATDAELMLAVGRALFREGLLERAERFLQLSVEADPDGPEATADMGFLLRAIGRRAEARSWLERAIQLDPGNHDARALLGNLLYEAGERRAALRQLQHVPPAALWDSLTVWRVVELTRAYRPGPGVDAALDPWLERLDELFSELPPEERLMEEVAADVEGDARDAVAAGQLDLFRPGADRGAGRAGGARPDWSGLVEALLERSTEPGRSLEEYMRDTAHRIRALTGIEIPHDDPEAFLKASARAGVLHIDG